MNLNSKTNDFLQQFSNQKMEFFRPQELMCYNVYEKYYFPTILEKLDNNTLKHLNIHDNMPLDLSRKLCKLLETTSSLESLTYQRFLKKNFIDFQKFLENNLKLKYLHLDISTQLYTYLNYFSKSITNKLKVLKLENYQLKDTEILILNDFLVQSESLEEFSLISNKIYENFDLLKEGIQFSKSLTILEISRNNFKNCKMIFYALAANNTITSLSLIENEIPSDGYKFLKEMKKLKKLILQESWKNIGNDDLARDFEGMNLEFLSIKGSTFSSEEYLLNNLKKNSKFKELIIDIDGISFYSQVIAEIISENTLKNLEISYSNFQQDCMNIISKSIDKCTSINRLSFKKSFLNFQIFSQFNIENNNTLLELTIDQIFLTIEEISIIMKSLTSISTLTHLNLKENRIDEKKIVHIAKYLSSNKSLKKLSIEGNEIGDKGLEQLCHGLIENFTLKELDIGTTKITSEGMFFLAELYKRNKTLTSLILIYNSIDDVGVSHIGEIFENISEIILYQNNTSSKCLSTIRNQIFYNFNLKKIGLDNDEELNEFDFVVFRNLSFIKVPYTFKHYHDIHFSFFKKKNLKYFEENDKKKKKY